MQQRVLTAATAGLLLLFVAGCSGVQGATGSAEPTTTAVPTTASSPTSTPTKAPASRSTPQATAPTFQTKPVGETAEVTHVVDGDTVDIRTTAGRQARIRLIGIDTPERGECNFGP